jgi:hypothetical protein
MAVKVPWHGNPIDCAFLPALPLMRQRLSAIYAPKRQSSGRALCGQSALCAMTSETIGALN